MVESILDFVTNDTLLKSLAAFTGIYLFIIWALFPIWVFIDAKKKYKSETVAYIFFFFILPFNIPGLIFYLIIRPEDESDIEKVKTTFTTSKDEVNIPLTNFLDENGNIVMSFKLHVNNNSLSKEDIHMDIDVKDKVEEDEPHENNNDSSIIEKLGISINNLKSKFIKQSEKKDKKKNQDDIESTPKENDSDEEK